jgi:hypothetical protein
VRFEAWTRGTAGAEDDCLTGATITAGEDGWKLTSSARNLTQTARRWLDDVFGPCRAVAFGPADVLAGAASGSSWDADASVALRPASLVIDAVRRRAGRSALRAEAAPAPNGALRVVASFADAERVPQDPARPLPRCRLEVVGVPGAWRKGGTASLQVEHRVPKRGGDVSAIYDERWTAAAGGVLPRDAGTGATFGFAPAQWRVGESYETTATEEVTTSITPLTGEARPATTSTSEAAWTAVWTLDRAASDGQEARWRVAIRDWRLRSGGREDRSLTGCEATMQVGGAWWLDDAHGSPSAAARTWALRCGVSGAVTEDVGSLAPDVPVRIGSEWHLARDAALRRFPVLADPGKPDLAAALLSAGDGPGATARVSYRCSVPVRSFVWEDGLLRLNFLTAPGPDRAGSLEASGTVESQPAQWGREAACEERIALSAPRGVAGAEQRVDILILRMWTRKPVPLTLARR